MDYFNFSSKILLLFYIPAYSFFYLLNTQKYKLKNKIIGKGFHKTDYKDLNKSYIIPVLNFYHFVLLRKIETIHHINNLNDSITFYEHNLSNNV